MCTAWLLLCACATVPVPAPAPGDAGDRPADAAELSPDAFTVPGNSLDAWNAVGQLVVRSGDIRLEGRAQMLDLHAVRFRDEGLLVLTRAVPLSPTVTVPTTRIAVVAQDGAASDSAAAGLLRKVLQRELPAEIARLRTQAAGAQP